MTDDRKSFSRAPEQRTLLTTRELITWIVSLETGRPKERTRVASEMRCAMKAAHAAGLVDPPEIEA